MARLLAFRHNIFIHLLLFVQSGVCGLYSEDDQVVLLNNSTFVDSLTGQPHGWVMEFFASWCGHCHAFAPYYKTFAYEIRHWSQMKVGAIDCADPINEDICYAYEVQGYPTVRFFPPNSSLTELGTQRESWDKRVASLKADTIYYLESIQNQFKCFPDLGPVGEFSDDFTWNEGEEKFFLVEDGYSFVGKDIILSINNLCGNSTEYIDRLLFMPNETSLGARELPALYFWNGTMNMVKSRTNGEEMIDILREHYAGVKFDFDTPDFFAFNSEDGGIIEASQSQIARRRYSVNLFDLEKTIVLALTNEIQAHKDDFTKEKEAALFSFIQVLKSYFPVQSVLHQAIQKLTPQGLINPGLVRSPLDRTSKHYEDTPWVACSGSQPKFGGYSCGQWMLWHTLTVQQFLHKEGDPKEVLEAMNGYIKYFFGCRSCATHFVNMTRDGQAFHNINTYQDAVLYLWRAHNVVNLRVSNTTSDDPVFPKFTFPSPQYCPQCYTQKGKFSEEHVAHFLVDMYSNIDTEYSSNVSFMLEASGLVIFTLLLIF